MKAELVITTEDVKNPEYDGRCRYGHESIKVFKKGTVFSRVGDDYMVLRYDGHYVSIYYKLVKVIDAVCIPYQAKTSRELALTHGLDGGWIAYDALDLLVKSGKVSLDDVSQAIDSVIESSDNE